jgi:hypothetical protein
MTDAPALARKATPMGQQRLAADAAPHAPVDRLALRTAAPKDADQGAAPPLFDLDLRNPRGSIASKGDAS